MRKIFTLVLFCLAAASIPLLAQDYDESFVFTDADGNVSLVEYSPYNIGTGLR